MKSIKNMCGLYDGKQFSHVGISVAWNFDFAPAVVTFNKSPNCLNTFSISKS